MSAPQECTGSTTDTDVEKQQSSPSSATHQAHDKAEDKIPNDPNLVDWEGENDPAKPLNWTNRKKWTNGGLLAAMTFISSLASSMFAPGVRDVLREFHSQSSILASLVVSVYVLGIAIGPLVWAPLSEIYGRLPVYNATNILLTIFTVACTVSSNLNMLIVFRFFAGTAGSCVITIGGGSFGDMFSTEERGTAMAIWAMGPLVGPVVGPVAGGFLASKAGWRWDFGLISIATGLLTIAMAIFLSETYPPVLLEKKAAALRKSTDNPHYRSILERDLPRRELFKRTIFRPLRMLVSPIVFLLSLYMAFIYGLLYLLFTTISEVFVSTYGFSQGISGLAFLGLGFGMMVGLLAFGIVSDKLLKSMTAKNGGEMKPEYRFPPMFLASVLIPMGFFLYGWAAEYAVQWVVPIIGTGFVGAGLIGSFMPISTYLIDAFTIYSASALAANTIIRSLFGAFLPLAAPPLYSAMGLGWGNSLLGFIALAMIPIPVMFWRYGEKMRTNKRFQVVF